jgi:hypothetical protein
MTDTTDPAALLTRLREARQSRDVWELHLAEQALEHAAPELAARLLELEAENKRLRKEMQIVIDDCEADYPPSYGAIKHGLRTALKGGEI